MQLCETEGTLHDLWSMVEHLSWKSFKEPKRYRKKWQNHWEKFESDSDREDDEWENLLTLVNLNDADQMGIKVHKYRVVD